MAGMNDRHVTDDFACSLEVLRMRRHMPTVCGAQNIKSLEIACKHRNSPTFRNLRKHRESRNFTDRMLNSGAVPAVDDVPRLASGVNPAISRFLLRADEFRMSYTL